MFYVQWMLNYFTLDVMEKQMAILTDIYYCMYS